jgi:hypothetical protein
MRTRFAPRVSPRLLREIERLAAEDLSSAEIGRRVGDAAACLGLPRPSYERVRTLVRDIRRRPWQPTAGEVVTDVAFGVRPYEALHDYAFGIPIPRKPRR